MSLPQIRDEWHIPARYGATVELADGLTGTIVGCDDLGNVQVEFHKGTRINIHPTDLIFPKGRTA